MTARQRQANGGFLLLRPPLHANEYSTCDAPCLDACTLKWRDYHFHDAANILHSMVLRSQLMIYVNRAAADERNVNCVATLFGDGGYGIGSKYCVTTYKPTLRPKNERNDEERKNFHILFDFLRDGVLVVDDDCKVLYINNAACGLFDRPQRDFVDYQFGYPLADKDDAVLSLLRPDGMECIVEMRSNEINWNGKRAFVISLHDITQQKKLQNTLKKLAMHDGLTGLYNQRTFFLSLEQELQRAKRYKRPLSLLMLDIDFFKNVNDTYGHQAGDAILHQLGLLLKDSLRKIDKIFRYGGEEIMVIMPETGQHEALETSERLRGVIAGKEFDMGRARRHHITVSLGVVTYPCVAASATQLVSFVDAALYLAKQNGRNRTCVHADKYLSAS